MNAVMTHLDRPPGEPATSFLAADIGGTFARVAWLHTPAAAGHEAEVLAYRTFACADFEGLAELLRFFVASEVRTPVHRCVLACAGYVNGEVVLNDNAAWPIDLAQVRQALGIDEVAVLNDLEALAYAVDSGSADGARRLCGPDVRTEGSILVIAPGTGLGAAVRLSARAGGHVLATEAGQMDYAPHSLRERDVLAQLAPDGGYVAYERIVSGPGLLTLYLALCALQGETPVLASPEAVGAAAAECRDARAMEAMDIFCASLGSFAGSLAMTFMADGVYLAGGFLHAMFASLERSAFAERFLHGRSIRALLSQVPVWVTEHGRNGVLGAARWYLGRGLTPSGGALGMSARGQPYSATVPRPEPPG